MPFASTLFCDKYCMLLHASLSGQVNGNWLFTMKKFNIFGPRDTLLLLFTLYIRFITPDRNWTGQELKTKLNLSNLVVFSSLYTLKKKCTYGVKINHAGGSTQRLADLQQSDQQMSNSIWKNQKGKQKIKFKTAKITLLRKLNQALHIITAVTVQNKISRIKI